VFYNSAKTMRIYAIVQEPKKKEKSKMKKMKWFCCLAFCICAMFTGCGKHIADSDKGEGTAAMAEAADRFPEKYEKTSDSGKVKFHCQLEIPQNMTQAI